MQVITKKTAMRAFWSEVYKNAKKNGREKPIAEDFGVASKTQKRLIKVVRENNKRRIRNTK